jgi:hypothetical protein
MNLACTPIKRRVSHPSLLRLPLLLLCIGLHLPALAQQHASPDPAATAPLNCDQVVDNLIAMNLKRAHGLHAYTLTQTYRLQYHGFLGSRTAAMVVDVAYRAPATKTFAVQSTTGSNMLLDKVLKRLVSAQKEAQGEAAQKRSALNRENYNFAIVDYESTPTGHLYVLSVKPRTNWRFLYSGQIWVNADDFAVIRLKAVPAKSPSFWTKHSEIDETYQKVDDFWLPAHNQSLSSIRFGGHAEMTIESNNYDITSADPASSLGH